MYEEKSPLVTGLVVEDTSDLLPAKFIRLVMLSRLPPEPQPFGPPSFFLLQALTAFCHASPLYHI